MRTTYPAWDYVGPQSTLSHTVWAACVAASIGATASASVISYLASDSGRRMDSAPMSTAAIVTKDPAAEAGSTVIQNQMKTEKMPAAVRSDNPSRPNNSISSSDVERERSTALQFEQPPADAIAIHRKTHRPHVFGRYSTPNHW